ncbi:MAG TPA: 2OG-Fe(II) oxygenase [Trichocoleus sp.]|jgi:Rps23 Pro-64 3,4-dihydroxylase Tpa1-like proline 4-hydroxylase
MSELLPETVQVTLLLAGGQQYTVPLQIDDPLLQQLFEVLVDWEGKRMRRLFQIPLGAESMLAFPCDRLVGVITEPPIMIQPPAMPIDSQLQSVSNGEIIPAQWLQIANFLSLEEYQGLLSYALQHELDFVPTGTTTGEENYRESVVLYDFPEFHELIMQRIRSVVPDVQAKLGLEPFIIQETEAQLTAHGDGNFYRLHNDNGSPITATRELTYVYYFYREPKPFSGGELLIYDSRVENNYLVHAESFQTIEPINNSIVFFPSGYMHEVLPIRCPSRAFADSRFTVNGWIRRP